MLVKAGPLLNLVSHWRDFLNQGLTVKDIERIEKHEKTGRPLGNENFIEEVELIRRSR